MKRAIQSVLRHAEVASAPPVCVDIGASGKLPAEWQLLAPYSIGVAFDADDREFRVDDAANAGWMRLIKMNRLVAEGPVDQDDVRRRWTSRLASGESVPLVAEAGGTVVGQASIDVAPYGVAYLGMLVDRDWRRRGVGTVVRLVDFGAFVEIFPGTDGLLHISEIAENRVREVRDELKEGDQILVKVLALEGNKIKLSRKAVLREQREKLKAKP